MSNELIQQPNAQPFAGSSRALDLRANVGAIEVESQRAITEAKGQMQLAKMFPRDLTKAHAELMVACKSKAFAAVAFYSKPQGGSTVTGPSIRLAEEVARVYCNFQYGHRELSRSDDRSEIEVYVWDVEGNNYNKRQKTVLHVRDTRDGPKKLRDQTDIDQKINNVASKEMRGLILAAMPKWLVEEAVAECRKTIAGNNDEPLEARVRRMTQAFAKYGVSPERIEQHLGHKLDQTTLDELVDLQGLFNSLKEGIPASELFPLDDDATAKDAEGKPQSEAGQKVAEAVKKAQAKKAEAPASAPVQAPAASPAQAPAQAPTPAPQATQQELTPEPTQPSKKAQEASKKADEAQAPAPQSAPVAAATTQPPLQGGTVPPEDVF